MSETIDFALDWPRSHYENILLIPIYVAVGLSVLSYTATMCIRLLWWNSKWHFVEQLKKIDHKLISYALDGFFGVLEDREDIEHITDTDMSLKEIHLQTTTDEMDARKAEETIRSTRSSVKINRINILNSKHAINILALYFHVIVLLAFVSFWDSFILETTFRCDYPWDCYVGITGQDPILDCDLINPKNTSVVCYRLLFDSVSGIANVGGIMFVAIGGLGLMSHLVLLVQDSSKSQWVRAILSTIVLVVQYTLFFADLAYLIYFHILIRSAHQPYRVTSIVQTTTTIIAAFICITSPWVLIVWAWNKNRNQQNRLLIHIQSQKKIEV